MATKVYPKWRALREAFMASDTAHTGTVTRQHFRWVLEKFFLILTEQQEQTLLSGMHVLVEPSSVNYQRTYEACFTLSIMIFEIRVPVVHEFLPESETMCFLLVTRFGSCLC